MQPRTIAAGVRWRDDPRTPPDGSPRLDTSPTPVIRSFSAALVVLGTAVPAAAQTSPARPDSARTPSVVVAERPPLPPVRRVRVDPWWGYDKAQHFIASGLVTVSAQYLYEVKGGMSRRGALPIAIGTSLGVGVAKEAYDVVRPFGTGFSRRDLVWDALGTAAAAAFILL